MTSFGNNIKLRVFGGSHDPYIGAEIESVPAGIELDYAYIARFMARRAPGQNSYSTSRREPDEPIFESGIDGGKTNGEKIRVLIYNKTMRSSDYSTLANKPRPSHADYPAIVKSSGKADLRGGGHFSGRLTAPVCAVGAVLKKELERRGIFIGAHIRSIGKISEAPFDYVDIKKETLFSLEQKEFPTMDESAGEKMKEEILTAKNNLDSVGGRVECAVLGLPVGLGEHMFAGLESRISSAVFSIPAVKGVEFGLGFCSSALYGSENNDPYETDGVNVYTASNNAGGIVGGMSTGMPLVFTVGFKPTPSIGKAQKTVDLSNMTNTEIEISGRHDPCIVARALPVVEAMAAIAIYDAILDTGDMEA